MHQIDWKLLVSRYRDLVSWCFTTLYIAQRCTLFLPERM